MPLINSLRIATEDLQSNILDINELINKTRIDIEFRKSHYQNEIFELNKKLELANLSLSKCKQLFNIICEINFYFYNLDDKLAQEDEISVQESLSHIKSINKVISHEKERKMSSSSFKSKDTPHKPDSNHFKNKKSKTKLK